MEPFVEDIGRVGFGGLLSEAPTSTRGQAPAESPGERVPGSPSSGPRDDAHRVALEAFHRWLEDERAAVRAGMTAREAAVNVA